MMDLLKLSELHFDDKTINDALIVKILKHNIQALEKNNPDKKYDALIADSKKVLADMEVKIASADQVVHSRISKTKTKMEVIELFKKEASKFEALLHSAFGRGSAQYLSVFVQGLTEVHRVKEKNIVILLTRFKEAADKFKDNLGDKSSTIFGDLLTEYDKASSDQSDEKGNIGSLKGEKGTARYAVNVQLQKNLYSVLADNVEDDNVLNKFFDLNLNPKSRTAKKAEVPLVETKTPEVKA